ncbi:sentrin-specific protease 8 [Cotesia typhae]|uniref:sentrin-specific protease 8 n=1 Tax=Cotesia typhae TaxID=2053667 RepID=UPI003D686C91
MLKRDKIVLSYHDSLLRDRDVFLLKDSHWLNDVIIGFYFEYLEQTLEASNISKNIKLFSPEVTQLLKMTAQEFPFISTDMDYIFFPLNDCKKSDAAGGSHWSLLVYSKNEKTCFHFDSAHGNNNAEARSFGLKISKQLLGDKTASFKNVECPQQDNGYDCGIFVLCFTDAILEHLKSSSSVETCNFCKVKSLSIYKRRKLLDLINKLSQQNHQ